MTALNSLLDLDGRTAIVTGGATHIGRAIAESLAELGATVYIASRREELCATTAADLSGGVVTRLDGARSRHLDVRAHKCDATREDDVNSLVDDVVRETGRLDIMVANAGGGQPGPYPPDGRLADFTATLEINLVSAYLCAQAAARAMIGQNEGRIITVGSIASVVGSDKRIYEPDFMRSGPHYAIAKGAIAMLTRSLACDLGEHGITVNCVSPGQMPKESVNARQVERFAQMVPLMRYGTPDDLKGIVAVLASDAGAWITGQNILVDGGWTAW